jgi:hypothetical protein
MFRRFACAVAAALTLGVVAPATAAELIQNGGFEDVVDGQAVGWTASPSWSAFPDGPPLDGWKVFTNEPGRPNHTGDSHVEILECPTFEANCSLSQTVGTTAGQTYELSFWTQAGISYVYSAVRIFWGAEEIELFQFSSSYANYRQQLLATSDLTTLTLLFEGAVRLDDVSLTPYAVPEPSTWALMLAGFGLTGGALRARRRLTPVQA